MIGRLKQRSLKVFEESRFLKSGLKELRPMAKRAIFWLVVCELALVSQVYPTKYLVDGLVSRKVPGFISSYLDVTLNTYLFGLAFAVLAVYLLGVYLHKRRSIAQNDFETKLSMLIWAEAHSKELQLSTDWHLTHGTGEKESIIGKNTNKVSNLIESALWMATPICLRILVTSSVMFFFGWWYGLLAVGTLVIYVTILALSEPYIRPMREEYHHQKRELEQFGSELTQNWRSIRCFGLEEWFSQRNYDKLMAFWRRERIRHAEWRRFIDIPDFMLAGSRFCIYIVAILQGLSNPNAVGSIVLAILLMERVYSNYYRLGDFMRQLHEGMEALHELTDVFLTVPTVRQAPSPIWPENIRGRVEFRNVCFSYENGTQAVEEVNLTVEPNQIIAFIGRTGSGKTTLLSLLQREHDPTKGQILIDGVDLALLDFQRYRQEVMSVVQQHSILFDETVARNISITTKFEADHSTVVEAARQAYAEEFVLRMPQGYETMIGENGIRLSGGQRQRLAIARALIRKPKILILDEPTSSLDPDSQKQVQAAIDQLIARRECTIFVIAHRFSTILNADKVVVMENGRIVEVGTHEELTRLNGMYQHFRNLEMGGALV
ncbi:MAG TPA: ABC transporter ATP-binding protein [Verrucomicrobiae bacterium]|nr:ABC transporter ATP-binding protein [Verrucomicrobiae bacterium]